MSDIQLQYQSTIFTEPKTQLPYSIHPASLPYPELQKFNPHSHIIHFKYPISISSPLLEGLPSSSYQNCLRISLLSYMCYMNTSSQLTWAV